METNETYILGIEAGIGCSVATLAADGEAGVWTSELRMKRADELAILVQRAIAGRTDKISRIVVGDSEGSTTGLRVALASALGLASAVGADVARVSTLTAVASLDTRSETVVAIAGSASRLFIAEFRRDGDGRLAPIDGRNTSKVSATLESLEPDAADGIVLTREVVDLGFAPPWINDEAGARVTICDDALASVIASFAAGN